MRSSRMRVSSSRFLCNMAIEQSILYRDSARRLLSLEQSSKQQQRSTQILSYDGLAAYLHVSRLCAKKLLFEWMYGGGDPWINHFIDDFIERAR